MKLRKIRIVALIPTKAGCALFLGDSKKIIHFFIDLHLGASINAGLTDEKRERPLTHDLFSQTLNMFGAKMTKMIITDHFEDVFYARVYIEMKNEVLERKVVVLDSRPSDALALAVRQEAALYIEESVMASSEDKTDLLEQLRDQADGFREEE